jgi:hypothetical protein
MSGSAKDCEEYARDCVRLAQHPNVTPEIRDQLFNMAREWMQLAVHEEDKAAEFNSPA